MFNPVSITSEQDYDKEKKVSIFNLNKSGKIRFEIEDLDD